MKFNNPARNSFLLSLAPSINNPPEILSINNKAMATGCVDDSTDEDNVDDLDNILKCVSKTSKSQLFDAIRNLLKLFTGIPVSGLIPLLTPACPYAAEEISSKSTFLHETLMELLCAQMLNLETWFIDENLAELYLLTYANLDNEDLLKPCRHFTKHHIEEFFTESSESGASHHSIRVFHHSITTKQFDFALKKHFEAGNPYDLLLESMQSIYPCPTDSLIQTTTSTPTESTQQTTETTVGSDALSREMSESSISSSSIVEPPLLPTLAPDVLCAVYSQDKWYRGQIQGLGKRGVNIDLIDFEGSINVVLPTNFLRVLTTEFTALPPRKCQAKFELDRLSSQEATDSRVLLALHQDWCFDPVVHPPVNTDQRQHSFLATVEVPRKEVANNNNLFIDSDYKQLTLLFFPLSVESFCQKAEMPKS